MTHPRSLQKRERKLIDMYSYCQLGMTPWQFYGKWDVTHETIAQICGRSVSTTRGWFKRGRSRRYPTPTDLRHLALMDFLLEHFEEIPASVRNQLCSTDQK